MQLDERVSELGFNFPLTRSYRDGTSVSSLIQKTGEGGGMGEQFNGQTERHKLYTSLHEYQGDNEEKNVIVDEVKLP